MQNLILYSSNAAIGVGLFFLFTSAMGVLRFPDTLSRLHALAKADNVALGCIVLGLMLRQPSGWLALKLGLIWSVTQISSAASSFKLAQRIRARALEAPPAPEDAAS